MSKQKKVQQDKAKARVYAQARRQKKAGRFMIDGLSEVKPMRTQDAARYERERKAERAGTVVAIEASQEKHRLTQYMIGHREYEQVSLADSAAAQDGAANRVRERLAVQTSILAARKGMDVEDIRSMTMARSRKIIRQAGVRLSKRTVEKTALKIVERRLALDY